MKSIAVTTEKIVEKNILQYLESLPGCYAWKNNTGGVYDPSSGVFRKARSKYLINGVSDILGVYKGRFLAIEVKKPGNKLRPEHQIKFIVNINKRGGIAFFASSIEDVERELEKYESAEV